MIVIRQNQSFFARLDDGHKPSLVEALLLTAATTNEVI